jgi:threonine/homoserine/homoserine lactone efflux protein
MGFSEIKEGVFIGIFLSFMIGPVFFMLIQTSIIKGFRAAFAFDIGVVLADALFLLISFYGSRGLLLKIKDYPYLFLIGGILFIIYGVVTFLDLKQRKIVQDEELVIKTKTKYLHLLLHGFFLNFINIGVLGFWLGLMVIYGARFSMNESMIFWFFFTALITYVIVDIGKILLAKKLREKMTPAIIHKMKKIMGIILIIFGLFLSIKKFI